MRAASSCNIVLFELEIAGRLLVVLGDRVVVGRLALLAQEARQQPRALLFGDVGAVKADEARRGGRQIEHVSLAEQLFGAVAIENRPRVDSSGHTERDARRAGSPCIRPVMTLTDGRLGRQNQVDSTARAICAAGDRFLDLAARDHHQIRQLVDQHDDEGKGADFIALRI